jgi:hypothetical protein
VLSGADVGSPQPDLSPGPSPARGGVPTAVRCPGTHGSPFPHTALPGRGQRRHIFRLSGHSSRRLTPAFGHPSPAKTAGEGPEAMGLLGRSVSAPQLAGQRSGRGAEGRGAAVACFGVAE